MAVVREDLREVGGYGFCNPAFLDSRKLTNDEYLSTIPDTDIWKAPLVLGAAALDAVAPEWTVSQIKEKFRQCRFYISLPHDTPPEVWQAASDIARLTEMACDYKTLAEEKHGKDE